MLQVINCAEGITPVFTGTGDGLKREHGNETAFIGRVGSEWGMGVYLITCFKIVRLDSPDLTQSWDATVPIEVHEFVDLEIKVIHR